MVKLSVVIPALNQEAEIGKAIQQFWTPGSTSEVEVLVVDAGSQDGTQSVARLLADRVLVIDGSSEGWRVDAKNAGAAAAEGEVLLFLDPQIRLKTPLAAFLGKVHKLFGNGISVAGAQILDGALAIRTAAFDQCGGFDPMEAGSEDEHLLLRLRKEGSVDALESVRFERIELSKPELEEVGV